MSLFWHYVFVEFSSPLRSLTPSVDAVVLTVLAGTHGSLSQTQVHRLAGRASRSGVALALERLAGQGVVSGHPAAYGRLYSLNREHVLAPAILAAVDARAEFLGRLRSACIEFGTKVLSAALYGSVVRGEANADSDVDLLLVVAHDETVDNPDFVAKVAALEAKVLSWSGNRLQPLVITLASLQRMATNREPIVSEWLTDADTLHGTRLMDLIQGALESNDTPL